MMAKEDLGEHTRTVGGKIFRFKAHAENRMICVEGRGDKQATGDGTDRRFLIDSLIRTLVARGKLNPE